MKNLLTAILPALALLALGGCASTSGLATSEDDGVYYSSQDRTTAVVRQAQPSATSAPARTEEATEEATNPDYNGNTASSSTRQNSGSDEYYDNTYTYMQGLPNYGPGVSYYTPYSPYTNLNYAGAWGIGACGFSPYGICDPFYSSFYSPFYGYGSGLSISFGFGRPWGYGGYGYGRPFGRGYGAGFYDPYFYGGPMYGGYYGRGGGYYGGGYYGSNFGYGNRYNGNENVRSNRTYGHRNNRASDARYSSGVRPSGTSGNTSGGATPGRARTEEARAPQPAPNEQGRVRSETVTANPSGDTRTRSEYNQTRRRNEPVYRDMSQQPEGAGRVVREETGGRQRATEVLPERSQAQPAPAPQPQEVQRRREGFSQSPAASPAPANTRAQTPEQPARQRRTTYEQPRPQRTYEQPRQETYQQPSSQPSYSPPSNSGGNNGGSSSGRSGGRGRVN
ncbi:hypothetical protein I2I05_16600 [Hymenobacter sp. BT683]|uniref:DUF3300 domain-containing protein n=1 Tax=Hymenobacter jeongseonensis TaxID=2791027 RepID=A0ABS0IKX6_9BACT|nr:hypothetical protein [Hymenobacter jeongseonensis]MBF9239024.1 hypothetical protein [Hymenobacter jeongseonensis]